MFRAIAKKMMNTLSKISVEKEDVVGVDITPENIRVAQLDNNKKSWTLTKLGYKFVEGSTDLYGIRNNPDIYVRKLKQIVGSSKITTTNAAVSIPVSSAIIKVINLPLMTDEELLEAIDTDSLWENIIQLSDALDEYSIFWQIIKRHTEENSMDLLFVASKLSDIESYIDIVRKAGLNPVVVDVRCFTLRNALEVGKEQLDPTAPIVLLEFGQHENYLLIIKDDAPFISDIYISDQDRSRLLSNGSDFAECQKIYDRLAMQISQILSTYQAKYKVQPVKVIQATSTLPTIDNAIDCLRKSLPGVDIVPFDAIGKIRIPENLKEKATAEVNKSVFSSVLGLATRKLDIFGYYQYVTGTNNINLLPDRDNIKNTEKVKTLSKLGLVIATILVIAAGVWSFLEIEKEDDALDGLVGEYYDLETERDEKQNELLRLRSEKDEFDRMLGVSKDIRSNQNFMYKVLSAVNGSVPRGVSLTSVIYDGNNALKLKGLSINDQNILTFINRLGETSSVERASLMTMSVEKKGKKTFKAFTVRCMLVEQSEVISDKEKS